jgi:LmbE family N-acetylglucosaminyl deacetylase
VLTVLAGAPKILHEGYNADTTGEIYAPDAVRMRRDEDATAMAFLSVRSPEWLELYDRDFIQRKWRNDHHQIRVAVGEAIRKINPRSVISPLGLVHPDHLAVANACIKLSMKTDLEWFLYMDMPYAQRFPDDLRKREASVGKKLNIEEFEHLPIVGDRKHDAFKLYVSQYIPLGGGEPQFDLEMTRPERYWQVLKLRRSRQS